MVSRNLFALLVDGFNDAAVARVRYRRVASFSLPLFLFSVCSSALLAFLDSGESSESSEASEASEASSSVVAESRLRF